MIPNAQFWRYIGYGTDHYLYIKRVGYIGDPTTPIAANTANLAAATAAAAALVPPATGGVVPDEEDLTVLDNVNKGFGMQGTC